MKIRSIALAALSATMLTAVPVSAQETIPDSKGSLTGAVVSASSGAPIEGAMLTLYGGIGTSFRHQ